MRTPAAALDELHAMPEAAAVTVLAAALAPHLKVRGFTLADWEAGLLAPGRSDLMNLFMSRLLLSDKALRNKLAAGEPQSADGVRMRCCVAVPRCGSATPRGRRPRGRALQATILQLATSHLQRFHRPSPARSRCR
jgi:hypothetical protein